MSSGMQPDSPEVVERQLMKAHLLASRHDFEGAKALLHELKENHHATLDVEEELKKIEAAIKEQTSATTRNLRTPALGPVCLACGEPARVQAYVAQSY